MTKRDIQMLTLASLLATSAALCAQSGTDRPLPVTPDNFVRAESDLYFGGIVKSGGFGKLKVHREMAPLD